jgi:NADH-quinone oxidoreductase subunit J
METMPTESLVSAWPFFFYAFAAFSILFSVLVVVKKSPVASAFSLIMVFFSFAGIYAVLDAHLIAALQIFVYAGAIMVLFIFVIMLLNADTPSFDLQKSSVLTRMIASLLSLTTLGIFVWTFRETSTYGKAGKFTLAHIEAAGGNTQVISELMFSEYILPFELIAAVAIAKRKLSSGGTSS